MTDDDQDPGLAAWAAKGAEESAPPSEAPKAAVPAPDAPAASETPEPDAPAPAAPVEGEEQSAETKVAPEAPHKKVQPLPPWMKQRLAEQTARQREAERVAAEATAQAKAAEAALEALRRKQPPDPNAPGAPEPRPDPNLVPASEVESRARRIAQEETFNQKANASYYAGKESYPDFDDALQPLIALGAVQRKDFQEAALATDSPHDVIYHLGSNPDEASKILGYLNSGETARAAAAMTKIELKIAGEKAAKAAAAKAAKKASEAPPPIRPVGGSAVPEFDLEKASDDEFTAELNKKARANGWW